MTLDEMQAQFLAAHKTMQDLYVEMLRRLDMMPKWQPIETAPTDGTVVWVYTAANYDLPAFQGPCAYHPDAGWCTDELRIVTHWLVHIPPPEIS